MAAFHFSRANSLLGITVTCCDDVSLNYSFLALGDFRNRYKMADEVLTVKTEDGHKNNLIAVPGKFENFTVESLS